MKATTRVKTAQDDRSLGGDGRDGIPSIAKSEMDMQQDVPAALGFLSRHNQTDLAAMLGLNVEGNL